MKLFKNTVDTTVDGAVDRTTTRLTDKVKTHFRTNKKVYLAFGAGAVLMYVAGSRRDGSISMRTFQIGSYNSSTQTIDVHIEALGDPGNIIQDTSTGTIYASQGQAARELGLEPGRISEQLNGKRSHVNGHTFEKLGKAHVAE